MTAVVFQLSRIKRIPHLSFHKNLILFPNKKTHPSPRVIRHCAREAQVSGYNQAVTSVGTIRAGQVSYA